MHNEITKYIKEEDKRKNINYEISCPRLKTVQGHLNNSLDSSLSLPLYTAGILPEKCIFREKAPKKVINVLF